jgi:hypothetical protein
MVIVQPHGRPNSQGACGAAPDSAENMRQRQLEAKLRHDLDERVLSTHRSLVSTVGDRHSGTDGLHN